MNGRSTSVFTTVRGCVSVEGDGERAGEAAVDEAEAEEEERISCAGDKIGRGGIGGGASERDPLSEVVLIIDDALEEEKAFIGAWRREGEVGIDVGERTLSVSIVRDFEGIFVLVATGVSGALSCSSSGFSRTGGSCERPSGYMPPINKRSFTWTEKSTLPTIT